MNSVPDPRIWPTPDRLLRASSLAVLAGGAMSGVLSASVGIDLIEHLDWAPGCAIRAWTGIECPGCGMTRALVLLGQFQFAACCRANPAAPLLALAMGLTAWRPGWLGNRQDAVAWVASLLLVVVWLSRVVAG